MSIQTDFKKVLKIILNNNNQEHHYDAINNLIQNFIKKWSYKNKSSANDLDYYANRLKTALKIQLIKIN